MQALATATLKLDGLKQYRKLIEANGPPVQRILTKWEARYRAYAWNHFDIASKGGGKWPPLSPITIERRRRGKRKDAPRATILRDTNTLFTVLNPGIANAPGSVSRRQGFSVTVGYGGPAGHPNGKATIADIAAFHNAGEGRVPKREIIIKPTAELMNTMVEDARVELQREANRNIS